MRTIWELPALKIAFNTKEQSREELSDSDTVQAVGLFTDMQPKHEKGCGQVLNWAATLPLHPVVGMIMVMCDGDDDDRIYNFVIFGVFFI